MQEKRKLSRIYPYNKTRHFQKLLTFTKNDRNYFHFFEAKQFRSLFMEIVSVFSNSVLLTVPFNDR